MGMVTKGTGGGTLEGVMPERLLPLLMTEPQSGDELVPGWGWVA